MKLATVMLSPEYLILLFPLSLQTHTMGHIEYVIIMCQSITNTHDVMKMWIGIAKMNYVPMFLAI